jgi:hypothetical protein
VGEELCHQSGAGSPPHTQSFPVEIAARSMTPTPRVERVSIVADGPLSGGPEGLEAVSESVLNVYGLQHQPYRNLEGLNLNLHSDVNTFNKQLQVTSSTFSKLSPQLPRHRKVLVVVGAFLGKYERSVPLF